MKRRKKKRLTDAAKRYGIVLGSVILVIKIPYKDKYIECSTLEEATGVLRHLVEEEIKCKQIVLRKSYYSKEDIDECLREQDRFCESIVASAWTRESFCRFIESIGELQKQVLALLVSNREQSDDALRKALKMNSNQALAGVLSGISKQSGILNISPRAVYTMKDERRGRVLHKTYVVADDFLQMCHEMNWPEAPLVERSRDAASTKDSRQ